MGFFTYNRARISKGKDYFKFAIFEILLVVAGVLIALYFNNLNEKSKIDQDEKTILLSLHNEISSSLVNLDFVVSKKKQIIKSSSEILKYTGPKGEWKSEHNLDSLMFYITFSGWRHVPQEGVLNEIINSGRLSIISDQNLKTLVSSLPKTFSQILEEDRVLRTGVWQYFDPFFNKISSTRNSTNYIDIVEFSKMPLNFTKFDFSKKNILRNKEFENIISLQSTYLKFNLEMLFKLKIKYERIQELIEKKYDDVDYSRLKENIDRGVWN